MLTEPDEPHCRHAFWCTENGQGGFSHCGLQRSQNSFSHDINTKQRMVRFPGLKTKITASFWFISLSGLSQRYVALELTNETHVFNFPDQIWWSKIFTYSQHHLTKDEDKRNLSGDNWQGCNTKSQNMAYLQSKALSFWGPKNLVMVELFHFENPLEIKYHFLYFSNRYERER